MRSYVPGYELLAARNLAHALDLLGEYRPLAGGTDVMVLFEAGKLTHRMWVSIWGLAELRGIGVTPDSVTIGALTTYTEVRRNAVLAAEFPMLAEAAAQTGGIATQNRGTLGGNIANASPAADTPPALLAYDAEVELTSRRATRWIPYRTFHRGYKEMDLAPDELLTRIRLPRRFAGWTHYYRKVGTRKAQAISKVCFAGVKRGSEVRVALGSVAPVPLLLDGANLAAIAPIDDIRSTAHYRARVAQNLLEDFLRQP
jgi:CO/xanthine dehydrogenase FAD-binding subunit